MLTISMAKSPWAFFFFFRLQFFFAFFKGRAYPFIASGTTNYRYKKSSIGNTIGNIIYAKNKKEEKKYNGNHYLNLFVCGEENEKIGGNNTNN